MKKDDIVYAATLLIAALAVISITVSYIARDTEWAPTLLTIGVILVPGTFLALIINELLDK